MAKNHMSKLLALSGAVDWKYDPHQHVIRSPSPSLNFTYGNGHGCPRGYTTIFYGPPKGGKTITCNMMVGQMHADDPTAIAIKFNTERRELIQNTPAMLRAAGIDTSRYIAYETKRPGDIFDRIEKDIAAAVDEGGENVGMIIIDSLSSIQGLRDQNADSVEKNQIGDQAQTVQKGLNRILDVIRDRKIALVLTAQVRAEMDPVQQMRGNTVKMQSSWAAKHFAEYFIYLEELETKEGRADLLGREFTDENLQDVRLKGGEKTGHKIRVVMKGNSCGPRGRVGTFTFNYKTGIVNVHEEIYLLARARNIVEMPNNSTYVYGDRKWKGAEAFLTELERDTDMQASILKELRRQDQEGLIPEDTSAADAIPDADTSVLE